MSDDAAWKASALGSLDRMDEVIALKYVARELGPFTVDRAGYIWCNSAKGGKTVIANVRGWGYLTGKGHGALGLSEAEGIRIQEQWGSMIAEALNNFAHSVGPSNAKGSE